MTGAEAWTLIAPIITPLLAVKNVDAEKVYEVYVIVYKALNEYDEKRKGEAE